MKNVMIELAKCRCLAGLCLTSLLYWGYTYTHHIKTGIQFRISVRKNEICHTIKKGDIILSPRVLMLFWFYKGGNGSILP